MLKRLLSFFKRNEGLILLLLLTVGLRIPSLYEPYWYGDEGIYLVLGQALRKGLVLYKDIHDNKPPLLYVLAAVSGSVFYFRLLLLVWFGTATALFFKLMQRLFKKNKKAWYLSTLAMIWGTTMAEGNIANAEIFIVLPVVWAVLIIYTETSKKSRKLKIIKWLLAGWLFSIGFLLKVPALFDMAGILLWLMFFNRRWQDKKNNFWSSWGQRLKNKKIWWLILGFLIPVIVSIVYYYQVGAGERYFRSALGQNIGYLASWETGEQSNSGFSSQKGLISRTVLWGLFLLIFYQIAKKWKLSRGVSLALIWFLTALFGALLSERPYPHYLIQPIVPAAILLSYFLLGKRKVVKIVILLVGLIGGFYYYQIRFWHYPVIAYYNNFWQWARGQKTTEEYRDYFDWRVNQTYKLAKYLKERTTPEERIFIWGDEPTLYALANRLPVGRYTVAYHVIDFNGFEETMKAFEQKEPKLVIVMTYEKRKFPELQTRLDVDYVLAKKIDQALIYRRIKEVRK